MTKEFRSRKTAGHKTSAGSHTELAVRLLYHLQSNSWAKAGQRIGVAVSGGADSVSLLSLLVELREKLGIVLSVVHFNHKLRGRSSEADEKFVARLAERHSLPCFVSHEDISSKSRREGTNLEDAARRARYAFFECLAREGKIDKVAVAHTADDQAETVLSHILRGTGLAGLGGIHPEVGCVFRPLLKFHRAELRAYLRARRQAWREDSTNRDTKRMRARIRLKLMPLLEKKFQPAVAEHLCQLADLAREDEAWLESSAELRVFLNAKEEKGEWRISLGDLLAPHAKTQSLKDPNELWSRRAPQAMSKRIIRLLVKKVKPHSGQLSSLHVDAVLQLAEKPDSGKSLHLPGGVEVRRERDSLRFRAMGGKGVAKSPQIAKAFSYRVELSAHELEVPLPEHSCRLRFTVIDWPPQGRETKVIGAALDRERISVPLVVRSWRPGDSMQPLGHQKRHRLSRLLNELGVSRWDKASWPVLEAGGRVAWARGLPVSAEFAAGSTAREGVVITEIPLS
ncbi:MAG TPA: tRNA lysidine(34) synthetase TilS [Candidatus Bathyarchaeia archaeon]|nr:tRNA lysidine(34) synthetase TilS [Candidatus Bathyarchaeia archaeon]